MIIYKLYNLVKKKDLLCQSDYGIEDAKINAETNQIKNAAIL